MAGVRHVAGAEDMWQVVRSCGRDGGMWQGVDM